ncbi:MAG: DUF4157 domain-containing protein [Methanoregula sp.]
MVRKVLVQPQKQMQIPSHSAGGVLRRTCDKCRKKKPLLQRSAIISYPLSVPPIVHEVLREPGLPLDAGTRAFFEPRFGLDFSRVPVTSDRVPDGLRTSGPDDSLELEAGRVANAIMRSADCSEKSGLSQDLGAVRIHTDEKAAESARIVDALAYSAGRHIAFGRGQYSPQTSAGKYLLAHELTHVMQAGGLEESTSDTVFRLVSGRSSCPEGVNDAPANSTEELEAIDARAGEMAQTVSEQTGVRPPDTETLQAYEDHFGLPVEVRGGFLNRLTGTVRSTQEAAINEELGILSRRFALVAGLLGQPIQYLCAGDPASVARAGVPDCESFAWSRRGHGQVILCPRFWNDAADNDQRAAVLLHEQFHIIWGPDNPGQTGEIADATLRGSGGAFVNAHCYNEFAAQLMGTTSPRVRCPPRGS